MILLHVCNKIHYSWFKQKWIKWPQLSLPCTSMIQIFAMVSWKAIYTFLPHDLGLAIWLAEIIHYLSTGTEMLPNETQSHQPLTGDPGARRDPDSSGLWGGGRAQEGSALSGFWIPIEFRQRRQVYPAWLAKLLSEKSAQPRSWELCLIWQTFWGLQTQDIASQITLRDCSKEAMRGSQSM